MGTFVLVHGGFHGAWSYSSVAKQLRLEGHAVHVPTLSGVGERAHLSGHTINLATHIQDVVAVILHEDLSDVVLCGHSYAGMVITGVAGQTPDRIRALVYLDAAVPEDGQSLFDIFGRDRTMLTIQAAGETGVTVAPFDARFFATSDQNAEVVDRLCTPHPIACFIQRLHYTGRETQVANRTYVLAERYQSLNHATCARLKNVSGWKVVSIDCGHELMIDEPGRVVEVLVAELEPDRRSARRGLGSAGHQRSCRS